MRKISKWRDEKDNIYIYKQNEKSLKCKTKGIDVRDILDENVDENTMRILILDFYKTKIDFAVGKVVFITKIR